MVLFHIFDLVAPAPRARTATGERLGLGPCAVSFILNLQPSQEAYWHSTGGKPPDPPKTIINILLITTTVAGAIMAAAQVLYIVTAVAFCVMLLAALWPSMRTLRHP